MEIEQTDFEKLAETVEAISESVRQMKASGISEKALILLIQHNTGAVGNYRPKKLTQEQIIAVIDGMETLSEFVFPPGD